MSWAVPLTDVAVPESDVEAVLACLASGWLTMGPRIQAFEAALAEWTGAEHAIAVGCGTAALHLSLLAAGVGPGDEVIVPAMTFVAGAHAVRFCGATPVFCDVRGEHDLNMDLERCADLVTPRTKAILPTHFMGYAHELPDLGPLVVEDCAQAIGARYPERPGQAGTGGLAGCLSFFSKKQLTVGEGGAVLTDDAELATKVRSLRSHAMTSVTWDRHRGHAETYDIVDIGFNFRMDEPRAALGLARLARLHDDLDARRALVRRYREELAGLDGLGIPWDDEAVERSTHFCFAVTLPDEARRDAFRDALAADGIQTTWYPALTALAAYADPGACPRAEELALRHCVLPLSAAFGERELELVVAAVRRALA